MANDNYASHSVHIRVNASENTIQAMSIHLSEFLESIGISEYGIEVSKIIHDTNGQEKEYPA